MAAETRTPKIALLAASLLALLLLARPAEAVLLRVDIVGNVLSTTPGAPAMQVIGVPFTAEIILDADSPDQGPGGTLIAQFDENGTPPAIVSYKIDGVQFLNPADASVRYGRQITRDFLALETQGGGPGDYDIEFVNNLALNYFGAGPYSLSQLLAVTEADFTDGFGPEIYDGDTFALVAEGQVTTFSVSVVPEPALLGLALGALPGVGLAARRRRQASRG